MSAKKYLPDITWEEVRRVIEQHRQVTKYDARVQVRFMPTGAPVAVAEVLLVPLGCTNLTTPVVHVRGEFPHKSPSRAVSAVLRLVYEAYGELERNKWLWAPEARRKARGEE